MDTTIYTRMFDVLPEDCIEYIHLRYIESSCDDIETSFNDIIDVLLKIVKHQYKLLKNNNEPLDKLRIAFKLSNVNRILDSI
jgi:hypothetical protein